MTRATEATETMDILLIEGERGSIRLALDAAPSGAQQRHLWQAKDESEATAFLFKQEAHADAPTPDLILLDLDYPNRDGHRVLSAIKRHKALRSIPVIALGTSVARRDVFEAYWLGANCYIRKPLEADRLRSILATIDRFWRFTARLPSTSLARYGIEAQRHFS